MISGEAKWVIHFHRADYPSHPSSLALSHIFLPVSFIVVDCLASGIPTRRLFMLPYHIPSLYFPLLLLLLFSLFAGPRLDLGLAVGVGYGCAWGWADAFLPALPFLTRLEDEGGRVGGWLERRAGFVSAATARGTQAWLPTVDPGAGGGAGGELGGEGGGGGGGGGGRGFGVARNPPTIHNGGGGGGGAAVGKALGGRGGEVTTSAFQGSGQTLGGGGGGGGGRGGFLGMGGGSSNASSGRSSSTKPSNPKDLAAARAAKFGAPNGPMAPASNESEEETATLLQR